MLIGSPSPSPDSPKSETDQPEPVNARGHCPVCGDWLVSTLTYHVDGERRGRGYLIRWTCQNPGCAYVKVL